MPASSSKNGGKQKSKLIAQPRSFALGIEFEKTVPFFPLLSEIDSPNPRQAVAVHRMVDFVQIVAFGLLPFHNWGYAAEGLFKAIFFSHVPIWGYLGLGFTGTLAVCSVFLALMLATVIISGVFLHFGENDLNVSISGGRLMAYTRLVLYLVSSVAFVPLMQSFVAIAYCDRDGRRLQWFTSEECGSGVTSYAAAVSVLGASVLVLITYMMNTMIFEPNPMSSHIWCRAHTSLDAPYLFYRVISIALMHHFIAQGEDSMQYFALWMGVSSAAMAVAFAFYMPYYRKGTLQTRVSALLLCATFSIMSGLSHQPTVKEEFESNSHVDIAVAVAAFLPLMVLYRYVALLRTSRLFVSAISDLREGIIDHEQTHFPQNLPAEEGIFENFEDLQSELFEGMRDALDEDDADDDDFHFTFPYIDYINTTKDVELSTRFLGFAKKVTGSEFTKFQIVYAARIFMKGIAKYGESGSVRLAFAIFLAFHASKPKLAMAQLSTLKRMEVSLPQRYVAWKLFVRLAAALHMSESSRLEAFGKAKRRHREALHHTSEFWQLLLSDDVDKMALSNTTRSILSAKEEVLRIYQMLLVKYSSNLDLVSSYATFCETVMLDGEATNLTLQCLRELRELKTANTMRGAKVKVGEKETLTQVPLDFEEEEEGNSGDNVSDVGTVLWSGTGLLCITVACFIALFVITSEAKVAAIDSTVRCGQLRGIAAQSSVAAAQLVAAADNSAATTPGELEKLQAVLHALREDFRVLHNALTYGSFRATKEEHLDLFREPKAASFGDYGVGLWSLGTIMSVALQDVATYPGNSSFRGYVLTELPHVVSAVLNESVHMYGDGFSDAQTTKKIGVSVLLSAAGICIIVLGIVVFYYIHKIEGVRGDIFSLFTLIPRKVLRRLHQDSRKRLTDLDLFFSYPTKKKVIHLIGATEDEQNQLVLDMNDSKESGMVPKSGTQSPAESSRQGSICGSSAGMSESGRGGDGAGGGGAGKKGSGERESTKKLEKNLENDTAFTVGTVSLSLVFTGLLIASLVLGGYSHALAAELADSEELMHNLANFAITLSDDVRNEMLEAREFALTGRRAPFIGYVHSRSSESSDNVRRVLLRAEASTEEMIQLMSFEEARAAISEIIAIGVRLVWAKHAGEVAIPIEQTSLHTMQWGNEETLRLRHEAVHLGLPQWRLGLINGSANDLSLTIDEQLSLGHQILFSEVVFDANEALQELLRPMFATPHLEERQEGARGRIFAMSVVAACTSALGAAAMAYLWLKNHRSSPLIQTAWQSTCVALSIIAAIACTGAAISIASKASTAQWPNVADEYKAVSHAHRELLHSSMEILVYPVSFAVSCEFLWLLRYRDHVFLPHIEHGQDVTSQVAELYTAAGGSVADSAALEHISEMGHAMHELQDLSEISIRLAYYASEDDPATSAARRVINASFLENITWSLVDEPDYPTTDAVYHHVDEGLFYTNDTYDLTQRTHTDARRLSLSNLVTLRYHHHSEIANHARIAIVDSLLDQKKTALVEAREVLVEHLLGAAATAAIAVFISLVMVLSIFVAFTKTSASRLKKGSGKAGNSGSHQSSATSGNGGVSILSPVGLPFLSGGLLLLIVLVLAVLSGLELSRSTDVPTRLDFATQRQWVLGQTMKIATDMKNDPSAFTSAQEELSVEYSRLLHILSSLYFDNRAEYFSVSHDATQDRLLFDRSEFFPSDLAGPTHTEFAETSRMANPFVCNVTRGAAILARSSGGVALLFDDVWSGLVRRLSLCRADEVATIVAGMESVYEPLVVSMQQSAERFRAHEHQLAEDWATGILAASVILLVLVFLQQVLVLNRFTWHLATEESSARLMLRIIPEDARESNAQIASFLESGRVKGNTDDLNDAITSMSTMPVVAIDAKGTIIRFTQAAEKVFQYTSSEVVGTNVKALMPADYAEKHDTFLANYRRTRVRHVVGSTRRVSGRRKDGEEFPLDLSVTELKLSQDEFVFIGFAKDVSREMDLITQDELNKYVLEMSQDPIITIDAYGQILMTNQAASSIFGYQKDELVRENIKMLMPSEVALHHDGYLQRYRETGIKHIIDSSRRVQAQRKNGEVFQANVTVREIKGTQIGELSTYIGFVVDVTQEHNAALQNEVNDIISDLSPVPIIAINDHGTFLKFSRAASTLFQYSKEELVGKGQNIQTLVPAKYGDHQPYMDNYFRTGIKKVIDRTRNITCVKRDKTIFPAALTIKEIKKSGMQPVFLAYLSDITESLRMEEAGKLTESIMSFSMIPIISTNYSGIITQYNQAAEQTFGYTAAEAIGENVKLLMPEKLAKEHDNIIAAYLRTREKHVMDTTRVAQGKRKDGNLFPAELSLREVVESETGAGAFFAYIRDVSAHRETLQQFMINDSIANLSTTPIIAINAYGIIESFSVAAEECFGYSSVEVLGENIKMLMPDEIATNHDEFLKRYRKTGVKTIVDTTRYVKAKHRDKTEFQIEISVREIKKDGTMSSFVGYCRDMSHDFHLQEEKEIGATIRDLSSIPIVQSDLSGNVTYVNQAACNEFMFTREEMVDHDVSQIMPDNIAPYHSDYLARYAKDPSHSTIVGKIRRVIGKRKDGSLVQLEAKIQEVRSKRSDMLLFVGFLRNLSTQLKLEEANYTIDTITNLSTIPIVAIDHRGIVIKFSSAAETAFGYEAQEVLGNNVKMLLPEEVSEKHDGYLRTYFKTGLKTVVDNVMRQEGKKKDGSKFPVELAIKEIVKQGQNSLFIGYIRDASMDTALERAMELSNLVTLLCPVPIIVINRRGIVQSFNQAAVNTFEALSEEIVGQNISSLMTSEDAKYHDKYLKAYARNRVKCAVDSVKVRNALRKSGSVFPVEISVREIVPSSGDMTHIMFLGFVRDLTGERVLKQASKVNDTIVNLSSVPLVAITAMGKIIKFSRAAEACFQFDENEVLGQNVAVLMPQEIAKKHDGYLSAYAAKNTTAEASFDTTVTGQRKDGETFPAELTVREVRKTGQDNMFIGYIRDISSRFNVVREKRICEASVTLSATPIITILPSGIITSFNDAAEECFGYAAQEAIGSNVKILMPRKVADQHDGYLLNFMSTGVSHVIDTTREVTAKRKNGRKFMARLGLREIKDDEKHFFVGYLQDVSMRIALEQAMQMNECIVTMGDSAIVGINTQGIITSFSPAAERIFGHVATDAIGNNVKMLMPEPYSGEHDGYLKRFQDTGVAKVLGRVTKNIRALKKNNSTFPIELCVNELKVQGQSSGFVASILDISERTQLEADCAIARAAEEMALEAIVVIDELGKILRTNAAVTSIFGYDKEEMAGGNVKMLTPEEVAVRHDNFLRLYKQTGIKKVIDTPREVVGQRKDGSQVQVRINVKEVTSTDDSSIYVGYIEDISTSKELGIAAVLSDALMSLIPAPIVAIDSKGIVKKFNRAAEEVFEFTASQVEGRSVKLLMPDEVQKKHDDYLSKYLATGEKRVVDGKKVVTGETRSGTAVRVEISVRDVQLANGERLFVGYLIPVNKR